MEIFGNLYLCKTSRFLIDHLIVIERVPYARHMPGAEDTERAKQMQSPDLVGHVFQVEDTGHEHN